MTLELTIKVTLVLVAVALGGLLLRKSSAAARHLLQVAGLVAVLALPLAIAVLPAWDLPLLAPKESRGVEPLGLDSLPRITTDTASQPSPPALPTGSVTTGASDAVSDGSRNAGFATLLAAGSGLARGLIDWLPWLWALGSVALLLRLGIGWLRMTRLAGDATRLDCESTWRLIRSCRRRLGIRTDPRVLVSPSVRVPMLWGFLRPTLLLPAAAVTWPVARLRIVLLHEMAHLGRLDGLALLVGRLAAAVWWFHPLVWFVERRARRDCERACDDVVLNCGERPSSYAGHLLEIAGELPAVTAAPAGSLALTGPGPLETRVMSILHPRTPRGLSPRLALAVLFVAIAGVVSVSSAHLVERAADRPDEPVPRERAEPRTERETLPALRTEARAADEILLAHDDHEEETAGARAFKRAYELHSEESFEEAIAGFEESAAAGYRVGTSLYNAACGYARLGRSADAIATLERSLEEGFDSYDLIFHDSDLDPIRSGAAFRRLLDEIPDPGSTEKQGTVDNYEAAVGMYNKLVADNRVDGEAWYMVGSMLLRLRDLERATDALGRAAEQMGDRNQNALYNLACANSLEGNDRAALDHLERAVLAGFDSHERFRNDSDLDNIRGESRFAEIEQLHDTLSLDRFRRWGGGDSEYSARRWAPAVDEFTEFIHRNPDVGRAWYDLGWSLHFSRRHEEARGAFEKQLELGYRTDIATYNIACTFAMEGRTDEALTWLERAVDTGRVTAHQLLGDEDLESLRDDERFETLLERLPEDEPVHLKHKWKVKTKKMKEKEATLF